MPATAERLWVPLHQVQPARSELGRFGMAEIIADRLGDYVQITQIWGIKGRAMRSTSPAAR